MFIWILYWKNDSIWERKKVDMEVLSLNVEKDFGYPHLMINKYEISVHLTHKT